MQNNKQTYWQFLAQWPGKIVLIAACNIGAIGLTIAIIFGWKYMNSTWPIPLAVIVILCLLIAPWVNTYQECKKTQEQNNNLKQD